MVLTKELKKQKQTHDKGQKLSQATLTILDLKSFLKTLPTSAPAEVKSTSVKMFHLFDLLFLTFLRPTDGLLHSATFGAKRGETGVQKPRVRLSASSHGNHSNIIVISI